DSVLLMVICACRYVIFPYRQAHIVITVIVIMARYTLGLLCIHFYVCVSTVSACIVCVCVYVCVLFIFKQCANIFTVCIFCFIGCCFGFSMSKYIGKYIF